MMKQRMRGGGCRLYYRALSVVVLWQVGAGCFFVNTHTVQVDRQVVVVCKTTTMPPTIIVAFNQELLGKPSSFMGDRLEAFYFLEYLVLYCCTV